MGDIGLVNLAILVLLCGAIGYGYLLSLRLERLRSALVAFGPALEAFCNAVDRTEKSVRDLRSERGQLASSGASRPQPLPNADERAVLMATLTDFIRRRR